MPETPECMAGAPNFAAMTRAEPIGFPTMDPLSDVLRVISLDGGVFLDAQFTAPWSVLSHVEPVDLRHALPKSAHVMAYHYVYEGRLLLTVEGVAPVLLQEGDVVLQPTSATSPTQRSRARSSARSVSHRRAGANATQLRLEVPYLDRARSKLRW